MRLLCTPRLRALLPAGFPEPGTAPGTCRPPSAVTEWLTPRAPKVNAHEPHSRYSATRGTPHRTGTPAPLPGRPAPERSPTSRDTCPWPPCSTTTAGVTSPRSPGRSEHTARHERRGRVASSAPGEWPEDTVSGWLRSAAVPGIRDHAAREL